MLLLGHQKDATAMMFFSAGGVKYALPKLAASRSTSPTTDERQLANLVLMRLGGQTEETFLTMAKIAIQWKDLAIWEGVLKCADFPISILGHNMLVRVLETFSFEAVRSRSVKVVRL